MVAEENDAPKRKPRPPKRLGNRIEPWRPSSTASVAAESSSDPTVTSAASTSSTPTSSSSELEQRTGHVENIQCIETVFTATGVPATDENVCICNTDISGEICVERFCNQNRNNNNGNINNGNTPPVPSHSANSLPPETRYSSVNSSLSFCDSITNDFSDFHDENSNRNNVDGGNPDVTPPAFRESPLGQDGGPRGQKESPAPKRVGSPVEGEGGPSDGREAGSPKKSPNIVQGNPVDSQGTPSESGGRPSATGDDAAFGAILPDDERDSCVIHMDDCCSHIAPEPNMNMSQNAKNSSKNRVFISSALRDDDEVNANQILDENKGEETLVMIIDHEGNEVWVSKDYYKNYQKPDAAVEDDTKVKGCFHPLLRGPGPKVMLALQVLFNIGGAIGFAFMLTEILTG